MNMRLAFASLLGFALVMPVAAHAEDTTQSPRQTLGDIIKDIEKLKSEKAALRTDIVDHHWKAAEKVEAAIGKDRANLREEIRDLRKETGLTGSGHH